MSEKNEIDCSVESLRFYLNKLMENGNDEIFATVCYILYNTIVYFPVREDNLLDIKNDFVNRDFLNNNYIFIDSYPLIYDLKCYQPLFVDYEEALNNLPKNSRLITARFYDICNDYLLEDIRSEGVIIDPIKTQCFFGKEFIKAIKEVLEIISKNDIKI